MRLLGSSDGPGAGAGDGLLVSLDEIFASKASQSPGIEVAAGGVGAVDAIIAVPAQPRQPPQAVVQGNRRGEQHGQKHGPEGWG